MVTGHPMVTKAPLGHVSVLEWAWIPGRLAASVFYFLKRSENNIMHKRVRVIGLHTRNATSVSGCVSHRSGHTEPTKTKTASGV